MDGHSPHRMQTFTFYIFLEGGAAIGCIVSVWRDAAIMFKVHFGCILDLPRIVKSISTSKNILKISKRLKIIL